jgi:hypothetical protein
MFVILQYNNCKIGGFIMTEMSRRELRQKARGIRSRMRKIDHMIKGSINFRRVKCGKPGCKCNRGELHDCVCITYKERGKTVTVYVDKERQAEALLMCRNYKKMKALIKELSLVNLELIRSRRRSKSGNRK